MNSKRILLIIFIVLLIGLIIFFIFFRNSPTPNDQTNTNGDGSSTSDLGSGSIGSGNNGTNNPPATSTLSTPQGSTFVIQTKNGGVEVRNFYLDGPEIEGSNVILRDNPEYHIEYVRTNSQFLVALLSYTLEQARIARTKAENDLVGLLGITKAKACDLDVTLTIPASYNENLAGKNYGLSFCPSGIRF